jgi:hypothetical protein
MRILITLLAILAIYELSFGQNNSKGGNEKGQTKKVEKQKENSDDDNDEDEDYTETPGKKGNGNKGKNESDDDDDEYTENPKKRDKVRRMMTTMTTRRIN